MRPPRYMTDPKTCLQRLQQGAVVCRITLRAFARKWDIPLAPLPVEVPDKLRFVWSRVLNKHAV